MTTAEAAARVKHRVVPAGQDQQRNVVRADAMAQLPGGLTSPSDVSVSAFVRAVSGAAQQRFARIRT